MLLTFKAELTLMRLLLSFPGYMEWGLQDLKSSHKYILEKRQHVGIFFNSEKYISSIYRSPTIKFMWFSIKHLPSTPSHQLFAIYRPIYTSLKTLQYPVRKLPKITKYPSAKPLKVHKPLQS